MRARRLCWRIALGTALLLGCAANPDSSQPPAGEATFPPSGFLGDYSALRSGGAGRARLVYLDAAADFSGYERVFIDPVAVWKSDDARFAGVPASQRDALARELEAELKRAFAGEFAVTEVADGPGTLRIRSGLTAALAASRPEQLRYIEVELELRDAITNARLAAAVDSKGTSSELVEAASAFRDWAERLAVRVAALRAIDR